MAYNNQGGRRLSGINPIYIYAAILALVLIGIFIVINFVTTSLVVHFGAVIGAMLVIANLRDLIWNAYITNRSMIALINSLLGVSLVLVWLAEVLGLGLILWIPALLIAALAVPLVIGRSSVYNGYLGVARNAAAGVRRALVGRVIR